MPRKRKVRRRKPRRRRRVYKRRKPRMYLPLGGFGKTKLARLRFCDQIQLDAGPAGYAKATYLCNGLNYIKQTASPIPNSRPSNFLRNMDSYENYCVLGSKITINYVIAGTANIQPAYIGIYLSRSEHDIDDILTNGITHLYEQPTNVRFRKVGGPSQSSNGMTISHFFSGHKFFGKTKRNYRDDPEFMGTASEDPTDPFLAHFQPFCHNIAGNNPGNIVLMVKIDFMVRFTMPNSTGN
jgi:hypothetical protein